MRRQYIGLIHQDAGSDFGVSFPDFPGVITAGASLDEAREMAEEALALHLDGMVEDGLPIPAPSSLAAVMADRENLDGVAVLVNVGNATPRSVRVNVTLPEDILAEIDTYAKRRGLTRSGFLAQAAKYAIARRFEDA